MRRYICVPPELRTIRVCWLMTLTGCLGVFLAADMIGFYFLLALLSLGACGLTIHRETSRAWRAGAIYIGLALLAEALLLMAFVLLATQIPDDSLLIRDAAAALPTSHQRDLILALLIAGLASRRASYHFTSGCRWHIRRRRRRLPRC